MARVGKERKPGTNLKVIKRIVDSLKSAGNFTEGTESPKKTFPFRKVSAIKVSFRKFSA